MKIKSRFMPDICRTKIKWFLRKKEQSFGEFTQSLTREEIQVMARQNAEGNIYGLTYIDFKNKCVFNGSDLGKEFSAKAILEQINLVQDFNKEKERQPIKNNPINSNLISKSEKQINEYNTSINQKEHLSNVIELLLKQEQNNNYMPYELLKKKERGRKE